MPQNLRDVAAYRVVVEEEVASSLSPVHLDELDELDRFVKVEVKWLDADRQQWQLRRIGPAACRQLWELVDLDRRLGQLGLDLVG